jgi:cyanophycinase
MIDRWIIMGGLEDRAGACKLLREFVTLAGGTRAQIVVMTLTTQRALAAGQEYIRLFTELGAGQTRLLAVSPNGASDNTDALALLNQATGLFFPAGEQEQIETLLVGTLLGQALRVRVGQGTVLGGVRPGDALATKPVVVLRQFKPEKSTEIIGWVQARVVRQRVGRAWADRNDGGQDGV